VDAAAFESSRGSFHKAVIHANCCYFDIQFFDSQMLNQFLLNRLASLGAEAAYAVVGVVAGERRQIHTGNGPEKPRRLPFLLHGAARNVRLRTPFHRAGVHSNLSHPIEV
jgi:hypothetical protein